MVNLSDVLKYLEDFAPIDLAAEWDNVGLLLGKRQRPIERVMTCLTITPEAVAEAISEKANLIVTHHPILFRAVQRLTSDSVEGRMVLDLIGAEIGVYCPHTAFDNTHEGINETLVKVLSLQDAKPLRPFPGPGQCKVVVFVPEKDLKAVSEAMFQSGAGNIGKYSQCSFRIRGTGTFFGSEESNPTLGEKGRKEEVSEWRLEAVCPLSKLDQVIGAMRKAHSYEEPAFDVFPLQAKPSLLGVGRIGKRPEPGALSNFVEIVKTVLKTTSVQVVGDLNRMVGRVAVVCGAGGEFLKDAKKLGADVLLTGEMRFHDCLSAKGHGMALVLAGHYATERFALEELARRLAGHFPGLKVWPSQKEEDPIRVC